jgi:hypothetical protein
MTSLHFDAATRLEQTALAQVPEVTGVKKQPSLQTSHLIVSSLGQHECCNNLWQDYVWVSIHIHVKYVIRHSINTVIL